MRAKEIIEITPNWPNHSYGGRYTSVTISVKISDNGRGLSRSEAAQICKKLERTARGRSTLREVSAIV